MVIVVEHRDRLARFGMEHLEAVLAVQSCRVVIDDPGETTDDLVRDMLEVLTASACAYTGRKGVRNRASRAVTTATKDPETV
jgi:putative resolvase